MGYWLLVTGREKIKRWGMIAVAAAYQVALVVMFTIAADSPYWRESLWVIKLLVFSGIFLMTVVLSNYFLRQIDRQLIERDKMIKELEMRQIVEKEANEEIISINQMVNDQVVKLTKLSQELESSYINTVNTLARALDSRDRYTHGHSERVAAWSVLIAERYGYAREDVQRIRQAALLHDIGKIGVQDAILRKDGPLDPIELKEMQQHPVFGYEILKDVKHLAPCLKAILHHHERIDGKGYPHGLRGTAIPLDARIIGVADTYDAMTSDRPYRKGMQKDKAIAIIKEVSGTQLDPELVPIFLKLVTEVHEAKTELHATFV